MALQYNIFAKPKFKNQAKTKQINKQKTTKKRNELQPCGIAHKRIKQTNVKSTEIKQPKGKKNKGQTCTTPKNQNTITRNIPPQPSK